jgi:hypothetical protein
MSLKIAPALWRTLCDLAVAYPTARFVLDQHEGQIVRIEVWQDKQTFMLALPPWREKLEAAQPY